MWFLAMLNYTLYVFAAGVWMSNATRELADGGEWGSPMFMAVAFLCGAAAAAGLARSVGRN